MHLSQCRGVARVRQRAPITSDHLFPASISSSVAPTNHIFNFPDRSFYFSSFFMYLTSFFIIVCNLFL